MTATASKHVLLTGGVALLAVFLGVQQASAQRRPAGGPKINTSIQGLAVGGGGVMSNPRPGNIRPFSAPGGGGVANNPSGNSPGTVFPFSAPGGGGVANNPGSTRFGIPGGGGVANNPTGNVPSPKAFAPGGGGVANNPTGNGPGVPFSAPGGGGVANNPEAAPGGGGVANNPWNTNSSPGTAPFATGGGGVGNNPWSPAVNLASSSGGSATEGNAWQTEPQARSVPQSAPASTSGSWYNRRYFVVSNQTDEPLTVYLRYCTWTDANRWEWFGNGSQPLVYTVQPGTATYFSHQKWLVNANNVRFWATTPSGRAYTQYRDENLALVRDVDGSGRRVYHSPRMGGFTFTLR